MSQEASGEPDNYDSDLVSPVEAKKVALVYLRQRREQDRIQQLVRAGLAKITLRRAEDLKARVVQCTQFAHHFYEGYQRGYRSVPYVKAMRRVQLTGDKTALKKMHALANAFGGFTERETVETFEDQLDPQNALTNINSLASGKHPDDPRHRERTAAGDCQIWIPPDGAKERSLWLPDTAQGDLYLSPQASSVASFIERNPACAGKVLVTRSDLGMTGLGVASKAKQAGVLRLLKLNELRTDEIQYLIAYVSIAVGYETPEGQEYILPESDWVANQHSFDTHQGSHSFPAHPGWYLAKNRKSTVHLRGDAPDRPHKIILRWIALYHDLREFVMPTDLETFS